MKLYYLAHPAASDAFFQTDENLQHARKLQRLFHEWGINVICPWWVQVMDSLVNPQSYDVEQCLLVDEEVVRRCDGIILTGHCVSRGMRREYNAAVLAQREIVDLVGKRDDELLAYLMFGLKLEIKDVERTDSVDELSS